jgi:hypothetical protein
MILFKFKEKYIQSGFAFGSERKCIEANLSLKDKWASLALITEFSNGRESMRESPCERYSIELNPYWSAFGFTHDWYDGPMCFFSFGWLHFQLGDSCKKCNNNY